MTDKKVQCNNLIMKDLRFDWEAVALPIHLEQSQFRAVCLITISHIFKRHEMTVSSILRLFPQPPLALQKSPFAQLGTLACESRCF